MQQELRPARLRGLARCVPRNISEATGALATASGTLLHMRALNPLKDDDLACHLSVFAPCHLRALSLHGLGFAAASWFCFVAE